MTYADVNFGFRKLKPYSFILTFQWTIFLIMWTSDKVTALKNSSSEILFILDQITAACITKYQITESQLKIGCLVNVKKTKIGYLKLMLKL